MCSKIGVYGLNINLRTRRFLKLKFVRDFMLTTRMARKNKMVDFVVEEEREVTGRSFAALRMTEGGNGRQEDEHWVMGRSFAAV